MKVVVWEDWQTIYGPSGVVLPDRGERRVVVDLVSQGASVFLSMLDKEGETVRLLLWCGQGEASLQFVAADGMQLEVDQDADAVTSVRVPEFRDMSAPWVKSASFADLNPKPRLSVSPEVQAVIDQMNANAIRRETILLQALERRRSKP